MLPTFLTRWTFDGMHEVRFFYVLQIPENAVPFIFGVMPLGKYEPLFPQFESK